MTNTAYWLLVFILSAAVGSGLFILGYVLMEYHNITKNHLKKEGEV